MFHTARDCICKLESLLTVRQQGAFIDLVVDYVCPEDETAVTLTTVLACLRLVVEEVECNSVSQPRHQGHVIACLQVQAADLMPVREDHKCFHVI